VWQDMHGMRVAQARSVANVMIDDWMNDGNNRRMKLIVGQGNHSHNRRAVLRPNLLNHINNNFNNIDVSLHPNNRGVIVLRKL
jgi:DNA-nicking Smr family endonuclease